MAYLFLLVSLALVFLLIFSKGVLGKNDGKINSDVKNKLDRMLRIVCFAPIIVFVVIVIFILVHFKSRSYVRLSHAFFVADFWMYSVIFYYITIMTIKMKKLFTSITIIAVGVSVFSAIYLTQLQHYEGVFRSVNLMIPNFFAVVMLVVYYYVNYKLLTKDKK
ncbi:hypothetical protein [Clostridium felsineum]|uniref:Uncharacterized protein n=1 Tax=Clostridium felsineum TaxID=36839 RepID=A0A1S8KZ15_9CLOT|nr:hypothetical protein [Clostridium felsineum]URZ02542.1 hypothetical protein CLAUR_025540 [Clostridium felsineum]URZ09764.1 hypothetical protein CROST_004570 [Clostridium felsineum]